PTASAAASARLKSSVPGARPTRRTDLRQPATWVASERACSTAASAVRRRNGRLRCQPAVEIQILRDFHLVAADFGRRFFLGVERAGREGRRRNNGFHRTVL